MPTIVFKINPLEPNQEEIDFAVECLKQGKIVALPTETVYGLAASSANKTAVEKLYQIKNRPKDKPFTLAISNIEKAEELAGNLSPLAYKLMHRFWPGPLTLLLKAKDAGICGLRIPNNNITLEIIKKLGAAIVFPSANISGQAPALTAEDILKELEGKVDLIIDSGKAELGKPSTIIDLTGDLPKITREGAIKKEILENIFKAKTILFVCSGNTCRSVMAKGLLKKEIGKRPDIEIVTAGIYAFDNLPPSFETLELLKEEGIDLSGHRARHLTESLLKDSDLILTMSNNQKQAILANFPYVKNRLYLLKEFAKITRDPLDIEDPIGRGRDIYKQVFLNIKEAVKNIAKLI